jgi:hypothetical protein
MLSAITLCAQQELTNPALILVYSLVDIAGWLDSESDTATGQTFRRWATSYLLAGGSLECSAAELWNARCGLVHTLSAGNSRSLRRIYYATGASSTGPLREMIDIQTRAIAALRARGHIIPPHHQPDHIVMHLDVLVRALREGLQQFLADIETSPARRTRVLAKAMQVFMAMSDEDLEPRLEWGRRILREQGLL